MNNILTLNDLANIIASKNGIDKNEAIKLINEYIDSLKATLIGEHTSVKLPNLGEFNIIDYTLSFSPDDSLAECINEPFNFFEPVSYDPTLQQLEKSKPNNTSNIETNNDDLISPKVLQDSPITEVIFDSNQTDSMIDKPSLGKNDSNQFENEEKNIQPADEAALKHDRHNEDEQNNIEINPTENNYENDYPHNVQGFNPVLAFFIGLISGMIIVCIAVYFLYPPLYHDEYENLPIVEIDTDGPTLIENVQHYESNGNKDNTDISNLAKTADTVNTPQALTLSTSSVEPIVTDTVTTKYFLASMSRRYYGRMEFWVYIYLENKDIISDPDHISPGTVVVIPSRSKYDIDPNDQKSIAKAQRTINEVYNRQ